MSTAPVLFAFQAEGYGTKKYKQPYDSPKRGIAEEAKNAVRVDRRPGLEFYRKYTESMLRRYMRLSMRAGRMPSFLGQDVFRGKMSTYRISSFEDAVIFVHDMDKCLERIDTFSRQILTRVALQEYTQGEAAHLLGVSLRTVVRRYADALDDLTQILLDRRLMRVEPAYNAVRNG